MRKRIHTSNQFKQTYMHKTNDFTLCQDLFRVPGERSAIKELAPVEARNPLTSNGSALKSIEAVAATENDHISAGVLAVRRRLVHNS